MKKRIPKIPRVLSEVEKREAEIRKWGKENPTTMPGKAYVYVPEDTALNEGNSAMNPPGTGYEDEDEDESSDQSTDYFS
jgi:hypothetical protein